MFAYISNGAFGISNTMFAIGNVSVIGVQMLLLFWADLTSCNFPLFELANMLFQTQTQENV
jgi:hypothetical protein